MKFLFFCFYNLFFNNFFFKNSFFKRFIFLDNNNGFGIVKSLSGLLRQIPYINDAFFENSNLNPNSIIESEIECNLIESENESETGKKCKLQIILPGYMEHDAKSSVLKK